MESSSIQLSASLGCKALNSSDTWSTGMEFTPCQRKSKPSAISQDLPHNAIKLREFLGLINFYHRFLPGCAKTLQPLHSLLSGPIKQGKTLLWEEGATTAFNSSKEMLAKATLLHHPKPEALTNITTDASDVAVGAVLQQYIEGAWRPIAYFSKKLLPAETRYSTFDRELLAIYLSIRHF